MSILGDLAANPLGQAARLLGPDGEPSVLFIEGVGPWSGTKSEERTSRDYIEGGQQVQIEQTFVGLTSEFNEAFPSSSNAYLGKTATVDGESRSIAEITLGTVATTVHMEGITQAP